MDSFFYSPIRANDKESTFLQDLKEFANENNVQMYAIKKPLGETKYVYDYEEALVLLVPKYKLLFINFGEDNEGFENYFEDFIEDLGYLSDKFGYKEIIGRPRKWRDEYLSSVNYSSIKDKEVADFLTEYKLATKEMERNGEFLISLLTGSINDIERVGKSFPETLLDKIKQKIILFDGDQTRFIYEKIDKKRIIIQGLAGTGKTELLLHKLKELYTKDSNSRIVFTCHNKILAESLRLRIPKFFDFMKVDEQIRWNDRLWAISSWGSKSNKDSGLYSFICNHYNLTFSRYSLSISFDELCKKAISELKLLDEIEPYFDYILIDESQDFPESFFELCEIVTKNAIYVAGDIFQNVFEDIPISDVSPDFLLNKCYRTDPRTLMFAHGLAMGLFGKKLRWLTDDEWNACGYIIEKSDKTYKLRREPLRRFEDIDQSEESLELIESEESNYADRILEIIEEIKNNNSTVKADDIGIVFLENHNSNYKLANELQLKVKQQFGWDVNIGYESKTKMKNTLFISNRNNVKGLEFPFMICITRDALDNNLQKRNSIYMMLTRSFLKTYFIISSRNNDLAKKLKEGLKGINEYSYLSVVEPSEEEKLELRNAIINNPTVTKSQGEMIDDIMKKNGVKKEYWDKLRGMIEMAFKGVFDYDTLEQAILMNYNLLSGEISKYE